MTPCDNEPYVLALLKLTAHQNLRATRTITNVTETFHNDNGDKLTHISVGGVTVKQFAYDAAGRRTGLTTSSGTTNYAYDFEARVTSISRSGSTTNTFTYNGLNTRISKVDSGGTSTYRRAGAGVTSPVLGDGFATFTPGVSERRGSTTSYFQTDRLGTHKAQTNTSQTVTATRTFDAFGNLIASSGSSSSPFGFAGDWGYQEDPNYGLKLLGHRYYDPDAGRFLTRDPIKDGRNWYAYCGNNPLSRVDPTGLKFKIEGGSPQDQAEVMLALLLIMMGDCEISKKLQEMHQSETEYTIIIVTRPNWGSAWDHENNRLILATASLQGQYVGVDGKTYWPDWIRIIAHEIGHVIIPGASQAEEQMVVDRFENPVSRKLGNPNDRGQYGPPN